MPEKLLRSGSDVLDDLAEQEGGYVASAMYGHGRAPTVRMSELRVGASLPDFFESQLLENRDHLPRAQNG